MGRQTVLAFVLATLLVPSTYAFSFAYSPPTQCGQLVITWSGGTAPYSVLITPAFDVPRNISIPDSAYVNGQGKFSTELNVVSQKQFLLTMSDSTGFGSGGTSDLLTVGDPLSGAPSCNTATATLPFDFELNSSLQQCRAYNISGFAAGSVQPVTIYGLIPLGNTFQLSTVPGADSYLWNSNVKAGTHVILTLSDGQGRSGGSSDLLTVGASDDNSCINSASPASTITGSPSASSTSSATAVPGTGGGGGTTNVGGIVAGAVIGTIVVAVIIGTLVWFCIKKRRKVKDTPHTSTTFGKRAGATHGVDLMPNEPEAHLEAGHNYEPEPYVLPASAAPASSNGHSDGGHYPPGHPGLGWGAAEGMPGTATSRTSKYSEAFSNRGQTPNNPARFVLHTDGGEVPEANEDGVVELPPQYTSLNGRVARAPTYRERGAAGGSGTSPAATTPSPNAEGSGAGHSTEEDLPLLSPRAS